MRIAVVGAGAVGGYFGGRLAHAGHDVHFVARGRQLEALRRDGLRVESPEGDFVVRELAAAAEPSEIGTVELVIVTVKAWQVPEAAESIRPLVGEATAVLPLQNGIEAPDQLGAVLGPSRVLGGLAKIISMVVAPGHVRHIGVKATITLGELDCRGSERATNIAGVLRDSGIRAELPADIHIALWEKFLFICPVSGVGAVTRVTLGEMRSRPETREMLEQAMLEVREVGVAGGVALREDAVTRTLAFLDTVPPDGTASMQRDIMEGRPSELESQNGAVVRLGRSAGVPTPVNRFLYHSLLPMEARARA